ncbi:MAG: isoaspartyl peptidase/L-asparaginase [Chitinophagales bacterium]|nr:isoaspartyl peptidase/L-asparaginase [Chitinophagales bacterium]MDW8419656.1 isoaspartyl peptidase/L-asparaginase [Chitinophagales bacterium]
MQRFGLALHGGAGALSPGEFTPETEKGYKTSLQDALDIGYAVLQRHGSAVDAVEAVVKFLEDCPLYNAGKGSVFNAEGRHEMDAAIMCGHTLRAGAVALLRSVKNPVVLARAVMEKSAHVFLSGKGAEDFAKENHIPLIEENYFDTPQRYEQWVKLRGSNTTQLDHSVEGNNPAKRDAQTDDDHFGTVGAVALDVHGNLAAATSTGGMTNKRYGRIGDSPIIGAGTYADNETCAVSCTGHGEYFIRLVAAHDVSALMRYSKRTLQDACEEVIRKITQLNGKGGLIAIDQYGNIAMPFNCEVMFRGMVSANGRREVFIYR